MDFETIKKLAGEGGTNYGNLTQAQKEIYTKGLQNPVKAPASVQAPATPAAATASPYTIQWGDTLSGLAQKNATTVKDIMAANPYITDPNKIYAGKELKLPTAVVSPTQAINDVTKIKETADAANAAYLQKEVERKAAADALRTQEKPVVTPTKKTPEEMIADEPDPGNIWIYDKLGNRTQILATEQVPFGYTATNQKGSAPTEEVVGALTTYRKFADGSYGKFNTATGEYQGFATQTDFTKAQTQKTISDKIDQIALGNFVLSPTEQSQIDAVKAQYERFIKEQEIANKNLTGGTTSRMALSGLAQTTMAMQKIDKTISDGLDKVTDLNMKMQATVSQMITAFKNDDLEALKSAYNNYQQDQVNQQTAFKQMHDETVQTIRDDKQQRETRINAIDNDIRSSITAAAAGGATPEQLAKMDEALANHDLTAAVVAGGDSLLTATGISGEYNRYKKDQIENNLPYVTFDDYQTKDANRKAQIARAGAQIVGGTNMTSKQQAVFNSLIDKQQKSPLMLALDRAVILQDSINNALEDPKDGYLQQNLAYSYIQALDTYQSAVREGELKAVSNIDSVAGKMKNIAEKTYNGQYAREAVVKEMATAAQELYNSIENAAGKKKNEYKALAIMNGIGNQYNEWNDVVKELNSVSVADEAKTETVDAVQKIQTFVDSTKENFDLYSGLKVKYPNASPENLVKIMQL